MRTLFANLCLVLVSCVAGLALCEVSLRLFYPKYRYLADAQFSRDAERIWSRTPHQRSYEGHPDTGAFHTLYHNNLALRQHRNFSEADLASATNIGVFGDSFVENIRMAAAYSFTEPLDYLLNQRGRSFNVLNFGVHGYDPSQSFLYYQSFRFVKDLDHVFFVYCQNDLKEMSVTGLFHLDEAGHLVRNAKFRSSYWASLMSRLHISYLILDTSGRAPFLVRHVMDTMANNEMLRRGPTRDQIYLSIRDDFGRGKPAHDGQKNTLEIFRQLIRRWKHTAEHDGSTFSVVLLPAHPPQPFVVDLLTAEDVEIINLYDCFGNLNPAHTQRSWDQSPPYRFKHDAHWNEAGNRLATVCLYRALEEKTGLPRLSEGRLQEAIFRYYAAFGARPQGPGGAEGPGSLKTAAAIREKYLALDISDPWKGLKEEIGELMGHPDKRIIISDFDVYLDGNRLIYVKEECRPENMQARFFLHIRPVDESDLPPYRRQYGFENRDFTQRGLQIVDGRCVVQAKLPAYPISQINTGQFVKDQGKFFRLWEGEFSMDQDAGGGERRAGN